MLNIKSIAMSLAVFVALIATLSLQGCGDNEAGSADAVGTDQHAGSAGSNGTEASKTAGQPVLDAKILVANGWQVPVEVVVAGQSSRVRVEPIWFATIAAAAGEQEVEIFAEGQSIFKGKVQASKDSVALINPAKKMKMRYDTHVFAGIQGSEDKDSQEQLTQEVAVRPLELLPDSKAPDVVRLNANESQRVLHRLALELPDELTDAHVFRATFGGEMFPVYGLNQSHWNVVKQRWPLLEASPYRIEKLTESLGSVGHDKAVQLLVKWGATDAFVKWATSEPDEKKRAAALATIRSLKLPELDKKAADAMWQDSSLLVRGEVYKASLVAKPKEVRQAMLAEVDKATEPKDKQMLMTLLTPLAMEADRQAVATKYVADGNFRVRRSALDLLEQVGTDSAMDLYVKTSMAGDRFAKVRMIKQFDRSQPRERVIKLARILMTDSDSNVQIAGLLTLYKDEPQTVRTFLLEQAAKETRDSQRKVLVTAIRGGKMTELYEPVSKEMVDKVKDARLRQQLILLLYIAKSDFARPAAEKMFADGSVNTTSKSILRKAVRKVDPELYKAMAGKF